jgi:hypothetical protein
LLRRKEMENNLLCPKKINEYLKEISEKLANLIREFERKV